jgi:hypothetical protein
LHAAGSTLCLRLLLCDSDECRFQLALSGGKQAFSGRWQSLRLGDSVQGWLCARKPSVCAGGGGSGGNSTQMRHPREAWYWITRMLGFNRSKTTNHNSTPRVQPAVQTRQRPLPSVEVRREAKDCNKSSIVLILPSISSIELAVALACVAIVPSWGETGSDVVRPGRML